MVVVAHKQDFGPKTLVQSVLRSNDGEIITSGDDATVEDDQIVFAWGKNDRLVPPAYADAFHRLIANSELVKLDDTGHMPMFEKYEEWTRTICEFLSKGV